MQKENFIKHQQRRFIWRKIPSSLRTSLLPTNNKKRSVFVLGKLVKAAVYYLHNGNVNMEQYASCNH